MTREEFAIEQASLKYAAQQVAQRAAEDGEDYTETYQKALQGEEE